MYIYSLIYVCVCVCVCVCIHTCVYICIHIYIYICIRKLDAQIHSRTNTRRYIHIYVCRHMCVSVCISMYMYVCLYIYLSTYGIYGNWQETGTCVCKACASEGRRGHARALARHEFQCCERLFFWVCIFAAHHQL